MLAEIGLALISHPETESKQVETVFLKVVQEFGLAHANDQFRSSPVLVEALKAELTVVPGKFLPAVCGQNKDGKIVTTPLGKVISTLHQRILETGAECYFLLTSGAAKEAVIGAKPFSKTRTNAQGTIPIERYDPSRGKPIFDGDIILITDKKCFTEEFIALLARETETDANHLRVKYNCSPSRPFPRIDIFGLIPESFLDHSCRERWSPVGHIFFPQTGSIHDPTISLQKHVFSQDTNSQYVLLVKTDTQEGFVGVAINFFPTEKKTKIAFDQITQEGKELRIRRIKTGRIPCFDNYFPMKNSPPEAHARLWHLLREVTWDNCLRLATNKESEGAQEVKVLSKETSLKLAREVIYPIAANPSLIITDVTSMRQQTNRTFEGIIGLLNGDPYLGCQYLLPTGFNLTDAPVYGLGIIDPKGLFPKLFQFLSRKGRLEDLLHVMEKCDWGAAQLGWPTFIAYIYEQTGRNLKQVSELLCPVFCSNEVFPTLVDNYVRKALARFYPIPLRNPCTGAFPAG